MRTISISVLKLSLCALIAMLIGLGTGKLATAIATNKAQPALIAPTKSTEVTKPSQGTDSQASVPPTVLIQASDELAAAPTTLSTSVDSTLVLGSENSITLRGEVDSESVAKAQSELIAMSSKLKPTDEIILVLDTPGGSVSDGNMLIETAKGLPQKVKTLTLFAASMGFHIAENLDERMILSTGTLMSHRITVSGMGGQIPGNMLTRINWITRASEMDDLVIAQRMKMSLAAYRTMIEEEYWVNGSDAVDGKAADRVVRARCGADMMGTYTQDIQVLIFSAHVTFSKCPLIQGPLAVEMQMGKTDDPKQFEKAKAALNEMLFHKDNFVRDYVVTGRLSPDTGRITSLK